MDREPESAVPSPPPGDSSPATDSSPAGSSEAGSSGVGSSHSAASSPSAGPPRPELSESKRAKSGNPSRSKTTTVGRKVVRTEKIVEEPSTPSLAEETTETDDNAESTPAPGGTLAWHEAPSIPETIRASFDEAIRYAQWMVDHAPNHPSLSVHEYRKTIRRLRAMVRLLRGIIDRDALRSIDTGLRSAVLPTSGLRDARILLATLERVPPVDGTKKLRKELTRRWEATLEELETSGEEARVLESSRRPLARLPAALAEALPTTIRPEELEEAARQSYRRARRTVRTAVRVPEDAAIHRARKRVKELRYQLEWLVEISSKRIRKRQRRLAALAQELGEVTDFLVLEESIERDREDLRGLHPRKLTKRLRQLLLARFDEVVVNLEELFEERSRAFVTGVASSLIEEPQD